MHVISQIVDGGATEADGGASAPVGPSVATPLLMHKKACTLCCVKNFLLKTLIAIGLSDPFLGAGIQQITDSRA